MSDQKHGVSATIPNHNPLTWRLRCDCKEAWTAPTYEQAEDEWRKHVHAVRGIAPAPMGDTSERWQP